MIHSPDRPQHPSAHEHVRHQPDERHARAAGAKVLDRVGANRAAIGGNRLASRKEQMTAGVVGAIKGRLRDVREYHHRERGEDLPLSESTIYLAYLAQKDRLNDTETTDDMIRSQLSNELIAKAALLGPAVSEALKSPHYHKNKLVLAEYMDTIRDAVANVSPRDIPAMIAVIKEQSIGLGRAINRGSEVVRKGYVEGLVQGARAEIAVEDAIFSDDELRGETTDEAHDLQAIDLIVERIADGKAVNFDVKSGGSYVRRIKELEGLDDRDRRELIGTETIYYRTGTSNDGHSHYLINADAGIFGEINTDKNEFTPAGKARVRQAIHDILDHD